MTHRTVTVQLKAVRATLHDVQLTLQVPGSRVPSRTTIERHIRDLDPAILDNACTPGTVDYSRFADLLEVLDIQVTEEGEGEADHAE
ncbi:hypothetical protein OIU91_41155 (plasmid) [Streptomyces sp. NBC_01456]|uniref:hypothetical protein n=1 Tax=unclassified Streptomyces TaxID=2593676 RepID=UPI002E34B126|nr:MULTISPECIES: hypothetical protein [unclassified Streptomyces]